MGIEGRKHARSLVLRTGQVRCGEDETACAILNVSESGACILVPADAALPDTFDLVIDKAAGGFRCRVVWREGARVGLAFTPSRHTAP